MMNLKQIALRSLSRSTFGRLLGYVPLTQLMYKQFMLSRRDHPNLFFGSYQTFEQAWAAIPNWRQKGWDLPEAASLWVDKVAPSRPSNYPVFFWLSQLLKEASTLIDYGGSIGIVYYAYCKRATFPLGARWVVVELPELVAQGKQVAAELNAGNIQFATELTSIQEADILISGGALQFMKESVPGLLERLSFRPLHIILNKIPLSHGPSFWTLHNYGPAVTPFRVYNECEFLNYFTQSGYTLCDRWVNNDMSCDIPFHPEQTVMEYTGLYFARES